MLVARRTLARRWRPAVASRSFCDKDRIDKERDEYIKFQKYGIEIQHPIRRTVNILKKDFKKFGDDVTKPIRAVKNFVLPPTSQPVADSTIIDDYMKTYAGDEDFQAHCDVLVIGGGAIGSSVAYWLKKKAHEGLNVVVVEKDPTYREASTPLSVGGLRQQFSIEENVCMSLFGAEFLRNAKRDLGDVDVQFNPFGYLMLATEESAQTLSEMSKMQNELGARNEVLTAKQLKNKFPWLNVEDIAVGCHGLEKEGWFDPWALLCGMKNKAIELGASYQKCEVVDFIFQDREDMVVQGAEPGSFQGLDKAVVKMPNGEHRTIKFAICVIAAGAHSGKVAKMARVGTGSNMLSIPLPVEPRKRYVYCFNCQDDKAGPGLSTPLTIDPTGTYFRRDGIGGNYLCGRSPSVEEEPATDNLDVDYSWFDSHVWPQLAHRVPCFEAIKVKSAWAGYYEMNTFDENGIVGPHPFYNNLIFATGFSGHGIQQSPAVGRAVSELVIDGGFKTIDLARLSFDRIIVNQPMYEVNIV